MNRLRTTLVIFLGAIALSGCTLVPTASSPQVIARHQVPFGLLGRTIPGTNGGRIRFITQPVYVVDATGHLTPSSRIVPSPPVLATVLRQLILGPTQIETFAGYSTALPKTLVLLSASIRDGVGYVDLATALTELGRAQEILAVGQLVLTARDVGATKGIQVAVGGAVVAVPLPGGARTQRPSPKDFLKLLNA